MLNIFFNYSEFFTLVDYFPKMILPFIEELGKKNENLCFEIILSFVIHWCQHFFEYYPNPPIDLLLTVSDIMK